MIEIRYSEQFYVNEFPNKGETYAKKHIEAFIDKAPQQLFDYLESQNNFGVTKPEFQAVIIGEPRISMFGKSQVAVVMIHSNFIAYTTASHYESPINRTYGYATFDNKLDVISAYDHLEIKSAYETIVIGVGTESLEKDLEVVFQLFEDNTENVQQFYDRTEDTEEHLERLPAEDSNKSLNDLEASDTAEETDALANTDEFILVEQEKENDVEELEETPLVEDKVRQVPIVVENRVSIIPSDEQLSEEDGISMEEDYVEKTTAETETTPVNEEAFSQQAEGLEETVVEDTPVEKPKPKKPFRKPNTLDKRFDADRIIISNNPIPRGFVFESPVVYAHSVRPGIFKSATPKDGYLSAYNECLDAIREDIRHGDFDAVFNLQFSAQSVDNYYEIVLTGDAVIYAAPEE